jgi:hypothetical protein
MQQRNDLAFRLPSRNAYREGLAERVPAFMAEARETDDVDWLRHELDACNALAAFLAKKAEDRAAILRLARVIDMRLGEFLGPAENKGPATYSRDPRLRLLGRSLREDVRLEFKHRELVEKMGGVSRREAVDRIKRFQRQQGVRQRWEQRNAAWKPPRKIDPLAPRERPSMDSGPKEWRAALHAEILTPFGLLAERLEVWRSEDVGRFPYTAKEQAKVAWFVPVVRRILDAAEKASRPDTE